jgi:AcrR family transcriptional regulator
MTPKAAPGRPSARQRLLAAADELFYSEGIHAVGIDRIIERAGVAKGSLYYTYGSKDELVRDYLQTRHARWEQRIADRTAVHEDPAGKVLAVFDALAELFAEPGFNGCAFINAAAEAEAGSAEESAAASFRVWLHGLFDALVAEIGPGVPAALSEQLIVLYDGANIAARMDHNPGVARSTRDVVELLLSAAVAGSPAVAAT